MLFFICWSIQITAQKRTDTLTKSGIHLEMNMESPDNIYEVKTVAIINTSVAEICNRIEAVKDYSSWLYNYKESEKIDSLNAGFVFRAIIKTPSLLKDRKIEIQVTKSTTNNKITYNLVNRTITNPNYCLKCATIKKMSGSWLLIPISKTKTKLINIAKITVAIPLPKKIVYKLISKGPLKTFKKLIALYP